MKNFFYQNSFTQKVSNKKNSSLILLIRTTISFIPFQLIEISLKFEMHVPLEDCNKANAQCKIYVHPNAKLYRTWRADDVIFNLNSLTGEFLLCCLFDLR